MASEPQSALRLFVALELPDDVKRALDHVQNELREAGAGRLRWVRTEGIHLTLKFLGDVPASRVGEISAALRSVITPFELHLQPAQLGGFGGRRLRVIWVGMEGDVAELAALANRIDGAMAALEFQPERRPFAAHLTLARVPDAMPLADRERLAILLSRSRAPIIPPMIVAEVNLMQSVLGPGGAVYTRLAGFPERTSDG